MPKHGRNTCMATKDSKEKNQPDLTSVISEAVVKTGGVAGLVNMQPITNGVLATNLFGNLEIEIYVNVSYGCNIPEVSWNIQERVKKALYEYGLPEPNHINIHIEGVDLTHASEEH